MKAVRKFRHLLAKKRPYLMDTVLGGDTRLVQPPLSMNEGLNSHPPLHHHAKSDDGSDRRPVEQALASEGVHRRVHPDGMYLDTLQRDDAGVTLDHSRTNPEFQSNIVQPTPQRTTFPHRSEDARPDYTSSDTSAVSNEAPHEDEARTASSPAAGEVQSPQNVQSPRGLPEHVGKGQAHDPLEEFRFLRIGSGLGPDGSEPPPPDSIPAVCESPPAAELDIYEQAYHEEVERIRSRSMHAQLYLTRRVEDAAGVSRGDLDDSAGRGPSWGELMRGVVGEAVNKAVRDPRRQQTAPDVVPAARAAVHAVLGRARVAGLQATERAAEKVDIAAGSVQAKMRRVQEESVRLQESGTQASKERDD